MKLFRAFSGRDTCQDEGIRGLATIALTPQEASCIRRRTERQNAGDDQICGSTPVESDSRRLSFRLVRRDLVQER